jgi:hypothetical protein
MNRRLYCSKYSVKTERKERKKDLQGLEWFEDHAKQVDFVELTREEADEGRKSWMESK